MIVPDGIEPVIAWRRWTLDGLTGLSAIGVRDYVWPHRVAPQACCLSHHFSHAASAYVYMTGLDRKHGDTPSEHCMCGYWALKRMPDDYGDVVGTIKMWGKIIEGEDGYRSEYAYPDHLYLIDNPDWAREPQWHREGRARMLAEAYGVECTLLTPEDYLELRQLDHEGHKPALPGAQPAQPSLTVTDPRMGMITATTTTAGTNLTASANPFMQYEWANLERTEGEQPDSEPRGYRPSRLWKTIFYGCVCLNLGAMLANLYMAAAS